MHKKYLHHFLYDIYKNGIIATGTYAAAADTRHISVYITLQLQRGDYIQAKGVVMEGEHNFEITRV